MRESERGTYVEKNEFASRLLKHLVVPDVFAERSRILD